MKVQHLTNLIVYRNQFYKDIQSSGADLAGKAWKSLQTSLSPANGSEKGGYFLYILKCSLRAHQGSGLIVFNPTSWTRTTEVVEVDITGLDAKEIKGANFQQLSADGTSGLVLGEEFLHVFKGAWLTIYSRLCPWNGHQNIRIRQ